MERLGHLWGQWWRQEGVDLRRVWAVGRNGFRELIRARVLYLLLVYGAIALLAIVLLPQVAAANTAGKIMLDFGLAGTIIVGLLTIAFVGTRSLEREMERRTILLMISKPLSRTELILGKQVGLMGVSAVLVAATMAINALAVVAMGYGAQEWGAIALAGLFSFVELSLLAAIALLFGAFSSSLLAAVLTLATFGVGHLSRDLLTIGQQLNSPTMQTLTERLYLVLPDLERLNLRNLAVYGMVPDGETLWANGLYGVLYAIVVLGLAVWAFSRREF
ncbi:MAG: ABC transporter permease [Cyanobacteria bacterium]|nr:ABC transporter permease [Cyanobacteriota bacterium]